MIEGRERRPLPARGDIGTAEIADDVDARRRREARPVTDLYGHALLRGMKDRVTMKPDQTHPIAIAGVGVEQGIDRIGVGIGQTPDERRVGAWYWPCYPCSG